MRSQPLLRDSEEGHDRDSTHVGRSLPLLPKGEHRDPTDTETPKLPAITREFRSRFNTFSSTAPMFDSKRSYAHPWLFQLPIFRLSNSGTLAVLVFFLVAGYTNSYRLLQLNVPPYRSSFTKVAIFRLSASVYRWSFRLYLPCPALP